MLEPIKYKGLITLHEIPEWTDAEFARLWPAMSAGEKRSRQVAEAENLITNTGLTLLLTNMSVSGQGNMNPFCQILSVGNGAISVIARTDTSVAGDGFASGSRKAPASFSVSGFQTTIAFNFASGDALGSWTNLGLYGYKTASSQAATTTAGTGALMTHAFITYGKVGAIAVNYVFIYSN